MLTIVKKMKVKGRSRRVRGAVMAAAPKPRNSRRSLTTNNLGLRFANSYLQTLTDPFEYSGIKLGYDCLVGSSLATAYKRYSFPVAADGSFSVISTPGAGLYFTAYHNTGASVSPTYNTSAAANATAISSSYNSGRIVSGGIRVFALFPETSAPGVLFAGSIPITTRAQIYALNPTDISNLPEMSLGIGSKGATATMRPQDNDSFVFWNTLIALSGGSSANLTQMSVPVIAGLGFPAGTIIWLECVQNFECLLGAAVGIGNDASTPNAEPVAADFFPSPERLFSTIRDYIPPSAVMEGVAVASNLLFPGSGDVIRSASTTFGAGSHVNRQRVSIGSSNARLARQSAAFIEELSLHDEL